MAGRTYGACTCPPLLGVIVFDSALIHLGYRDRDPVDLCVDDSIVRRTVWVVAGGAVQGLGKVRQASPGHTVAPGCNLGTNRVVDRGNRYALIIDETTAEQGRIVGRISRTVVIVTTQIVARR